MGIHQAVLRKGEMEEKLRLLNQNVQHLAIESLPEVEEDLGEGDAEAANQSQEFKGKNRRSVDIIRKLEDQLGLPISTKNARIMNYKDKMHVSKDELMKSQESAKLFVEKMKEKQKEVEKLRKMNRERAKNKTQQLINDNIEKFKDEVNKRQQDVHKRNDAIKEVRVQEKDIKSQRDQTYKDYIKKQKNGKYLHEEIEDRFNKDILMPELERKKKELESIRQLYKPIKREELDEHEKNYQEKIKIEREKQRMKREKWYSDIGYGVYDENRYKTKFYEQVIEEEKNKGVKERVVSQNRKRKQEKMNSYAKIVKEMHWPSISEKKKKELEELKNVVDNSGKPKFRSPDIRSRYGANSSESPEREQLIKKPDWKRFKNSMVPEPQAKREPVHIDWLGERRKVRDDNNKAGMNQSMAWKNIADNQDLDEEARMQILKNRSKMIEETAQRKEQMNKIRGSTMEGTVEVNEMLINAIESKLSLLDNFI